MRIVCFESRLQHLGGGGRYALAFAEALSAQHHVDFLHEGTVNLDLIAQRWGSDLTRLTLRQVPGGNDTHISELTRNYDVFVNAAQGRFIQPQAKQSVYLVFFPTAINLTPAGRIRRQVGLWLKRLASRLPEALTDMLLLPALRERMNQLPTHQHIQAMRAHQQIVALSQYTQQWVRRYWHRESNIIYPPCEAIPAAPQKIERIVHVGRFFVGGHNKKHEAIIRAFIELAPQLRALGPWELHLAGGLVNGAEHRAYYERLCQLAQGHAIHLHHNLSSAQLNELIGQAAIYWHATGYGEDLQRYPDRAEHFGISVVEAMSAGCVPVAFNAGGPTEIIQHEVNGFLWHQLTELQTYTLMLVRDHQRRAQLAQAAIQRSDAFSTPRFVQRVRTLFANWS
jgi:glycosyltransferase involved in cell wall biosynthesis